MVLRFFLFAVAFLFVSCTELGERDNPDDPHGINFRNGSSSGEPSSSSAASPPPPPSSSSSVVAPSSSSIASPPPPSSSSSKPSSSSYVAPPPIPSSSSVAAPSSSSVAQPPPSSSSSAPTQSGVTYGPSVTYQGETYETVVIGSQTWFKRNLNYDASGSKCYKNEGANCATYGRLYNWATAMALPADCNSKSCSGQITGKHKGICPTGWHISSDDDWNVLMTAVGGASTAGTKLKATSGWNEYQGRSGNGEDTYGFSALPGGYGTSSGSFDDVGNYGNWWIAKEYDASNTYRRSMYYNYANVTSDDLDKSGLYSVRCVQD